MANLVQRPNDASFTALGYSIGTPRTLQRPSIGPTVTDSGIGPGDAHGVADTASGIRPKLAESAWAALGRWWWPAVVVLYVLAFVPGGRNDYSTAVSIRYWILAVGVVGGALFEAVAWRSTSMVTVARAALRHPPVLLALAYGLFAVVSAVVSDNAAIGLTGSLIGGDDGAFAVLLFVSAFVLVYARRRRDPGLDGRLIAGFLLMGLVSAIWATAELVAGRGFVFSSTVLPIVVSHAPGFLAGTMLFVVAVSLAHRGRRLVATVPVALLSAFTVGLTMNRTTLVVLGCFLVAWWLLSRTLQRTLLIAGVIGAVVLGYAAMASVSSTRGDLFRTDALSTNTLGTRMTMWRIGLDGIMARPLLGWGGSDQFLASWTDVTRPELVFDLLRREEGFTEILGVTSTEGQLPVLMVRRRDDSVVPYRLLKLKVHNHVLDVAILWGLPAALALVALVALAARNALKGSALAIAVVVYFGFAMLWFVPYSFEGAFWIALAGAQSASRSPLAVRDATTSTAIPPSHG